MYCNNNTVGYSLEDTNTSLFKGINNWIDVARELSILNGSKNVVVDYIRDKREYCFVNSDFSIETARAVVEEYNNEIENASTIGEASKVMLKYLDSIVALGGKESEITNYTNFLMKYYYGVDIRMDNFYEDGPELSAFIRATETPVQEDLIMKFIKENFHISGIDLLTHNALCTRFSVRERGLCVRKVFTMLNKYTLHNYLKHGSYTFLKDKQADVYNEIVNSFKSTGDVPVLANLYLDLEEFPKREFNVLIKDTCIQVF